MWAKTGTGPETREKHSADRNGSAKEKALSYGILGNQNSGLPGKGEIAAGEGLEGCVDGFRPGYHHDIPAGLEFAFVQAVDLPQSSADPVANHGMPQLFAYGNAYPVGGGSVLPGVEHQTAVSLTVGVIKPPENVIQFQRT